MIEDERTKEVYPQTINVRILEYIDRTIKSVETKIESNCDVWRLELGGLRNEWVLEHRNLVNRVDSFIEQYERNNTEIDKHFLRSNDLQQAMNNLQKTFISNDKLEDKLRFLVASLDTKYLDSATIDKKIEDVLVRADRNSLKYTALVGSIIALLAGIVAALLIKII